MSVRSILTLAVLILIPQIILSQKDADVDSLLEILNSPLTNEESFFKTSVNLANYYVYMDIDSADYYLKKAMSYKDKFDLDKSYYRHFLVKAWVCQGNGKLVCAKNNLLSAIEILDDNNDRSKRIELQLNLGSVLADLRDTTTLSFLDDLLMDVNKDTDKYEFRVWLFIQQLRARAFAQKLNYKKAISILIASIKEQHFNSLEAHDRYGVFNNLSKFLQEVRDYNNALIYLNQAYETEGLYNFEKKFILSNLSELYFNMEEFDKSEEYLYKMFEVGKFTGEESYRYFQRKAKLFYVKDDFNSANEAIIRSNKYAAELDDAEALLLNHILESRINSKIGNINNSNSILKNAKEILVKNPQLIDLNIEQSIATIELSNEIFRNSPELEPLFAKHLKATRKLRKFENDKTIKELTIAYESEKKEQEIVILKNEQEIKEEKIKRQRSYLYGSIMGILGLLFGLYYLFKTNKLNKAIYEREVNLLLQKNEFWRSRLQQFRNDKKKIKLSENDSIEFTDYDPLPLMNLVYIQSDGNYLKLFTTDRDKPILQRGTLKGFNQEFLPNNVFTRINNRIIINVNFIQSRKSLSLKIHYKDEIKEFSIGRSWKKSFNKLYDELEDDTKMIN